MRLLIKFGYIGWLFTGYQTGNGERSVEDTILKVLRSNKLAEMIHSAARTDRGVSALSNAFAIDTTDRPSKVLGILNSSIQGMLFHSYAEVPDDFNPRYCDYKVYRYVIPAEESGPYLKEALRKFRGRHDFSNFCKKDERNPVRAIRSIQVRRRGGMITVDFKARSFLWNQIRTIMAYGVDNSHEITEADPFSLDSRYGRLLEPESLILYEMVYENVEFETALSLSKIRQFKSCLRTYDIRNSILGNFAGILETKGK